MRMFQPSFSSGEISPLLHARVDLARYSTSLAKLKNMIVLPQGGVTRRIGFEEHGKALRDSDEVRLIPFVYNASDGVILEFGEKKIRAWSDTPSFGWHNTATFASPYSSEDVKSLRYVQSGNVMFLAHREYPLQMLTRESLESWKLEAFPFKGGPWIEGSEVAAEAVLAVETLVSLDGSSGGISVKSDKEGTFTSDMVGVLIRVDYSVSGEYNEFSSGLNEWVSSKYFEVGRSMNVSTGNKWTGKLKISRSVDGGETWTLLREFRRDDPETEGQIDYTVTETNDGVLYMVEAQHTGSVPIHVKVSVEGFLKTLSAKIYEVGSDGSWVHAHVMNEDYYRRIESETKVVDWGLGAWGREGGYPGAVAFYQDRLVLAGSERQPQTIWMSRVGDYADFSVSDPLSEDDAINITLTAPTADGIHSLVTASDLLAFTESGEWKISGAGDAGAISPMAVVAHQQTTIGSKSIQPVLTGGHVIFVQTQGKKVYSLSYDLNTDGYTGSEISILSAHLFDWKTEKKEAAPEREITEFTYQQTPDSILWFVLSDGSAVTCTYNPEHEVIGWARQEMNGKFKTLAWLPSGNELLGVIHFNSINADVFVRQRKETGIPALDALYYTDSGESYESSLETLRLNITGEEGSMYTAKKLIPRLAVSAIRTEEAWAAPAFRTTKSTNWERRRKLNWDYTGELTDAEIQLDSGFARDAAIEIRASGDEPLTIAAVSPLVTFGS